MIERDDLARWAESTSEDARRRVHHGFQPSLPGWEPVRTRNIPSDSERIEHWVLFERDTALVRIDVTECPDWRDAQLRLAELVDNCMNGEIYPTAGPDAEIPLGDVRFTTRIGERLTAATFASGNLCVNIASASRNLVDVGEAAVRIDDELRRAQTQKRG